MNQEAELNLLIGLILLVLAGMLAVLLGIAMRPASNGCCRLSPYQESRMRYVEAELQRLAIRKER